MATLRKQISSDHLWVVINYFYRAVKDNRLEGLQDVEKIKASKSLKKLMEEQDKKILASSLHAWIEKYVSQTNWRKCFGTLRQLKYRRQRQAKVLTVDGNAYHRLKRYAKKEKLSLSEAIGELLKQRGY
jgi:macrodomain Ter protein organizer (MatP/YcbG family)